MKNSFLYTAIAIMAIILGAGLEEALPRPLGVGFPILLSLVLFCTFRCPIAMSVPFALVAGSVEDAISALPALTSCGYFLAIVLLMRRFSSVSAFIAVSYPCYQIWLTIWISSIGARVFSRILLSIPLGMFTAAVVGIVLGFCMRKVSTDEQG